MYPTFCVSCLNLVSDDVVFCSDCVCKLKSIVSIFVPIIKKKSLKVFAAGSYQEILKDLVIKKFVRDMIASKQLGQIITQIVPYEELNVDYIIPIPLHWTRYAWRGYNQAKIIASVIGNKTKTIVIEPLKRKRRTSFQSKLAFDERKENVKDVFSIGFWHKNMPVNLNGKKLLLVDDLYTTGATLVSAAKTILNHANPDSISAVVGCRVL